jgi:DNA recombination protein RmuC
MSLFQIYIAAGIAFFVLFLIILTLSVKLSRKKRGLTDSLKETDALRMKATLLEQRYQDILAQAEQLQTQKGNLEQQILTLQTQFSAYKATAEGESRHLNEQIAFLQNLKEDMTLKFKDISNEVMKTQHESFGNNQKQTLSAILTPFADELKHFKEEVAATRKESIENKGNLDAQLANLSELNHSLSVEAKNLTEALKGSKKAQGNWGECQLSRILEISGLRHGIDYETQETFLNEDKKMLRPDVIIHLPESRDIIVDSKVSLVDYLEATSTEDEAERQKYLQKNVQSLKNHIDELSDKEYQKLLKNTSLNYVIMFIPVESAYIAALDYDRYLYDYAYKKNVILATPLSLLPTLRTVENLWRMSDQNQNVQKIAELGGKIYDKLAAFVDDMKGLERGMRAANNAYNAAMTKLAGRGGALPQAEKMKSLGAVTNKNINLDLSDTGLLLENNVETTAEGADND